MIKEVKWRAGKYLIPGKIEDDGRRLYLHAPYNKELVEEFKMMEGRKWHGFDEANPRKIWSIKKSSRNDFQLEYLTGGDPYIPYDRDISDSSLKSIFPTERYNLSKKSVLKLFAHTPEMAAHLYYRRQCILAGEMGTAKTIACILALEAVARQFQEELKYIPKIIYVAPRSALKAVQREFIIWDCPLRGHIEFMTYEGLTSLVKKADKPDDIDGGVLILDESSKVKNPQSQRSQAAKIVADTFRERYGDKACVWLMSGSPAPKSPVDWWSQAEIARPGYLKEGDVHKFKNRLGIIVQKQDMSGGSYPVLVTWKDSELKCNICGQESTKHLTEIFDHAFVKGENEIARLYRRLSGLVYIKFKKDCLDLPDKNYRVIEVKPSASVLRVAKSIPKIAKTAIEALTRLRELSDGFQYVEGKEGTKTCDLCGGSGTTTVPDEKVNDTQAPLRFNSGSVPTSTVACPNCKGKGEVPKEVRLTKEVACPKDDILVDLLDEHEDVGRLVVYAGFTASIDRCVKLCLRQKWAVIRVDQGKDTIFNQDGQVIKGDYLSIFQDRLDEYPRVVFIAHPGSAGMGLTLTASPTIVYYSNDFNAESRIQSEDRIHRAGMDVNRGATIIDIIHLPSDAKVLENLKQKRELQAMTLGDVATFIKEEESNGDQRRETAYQSTAGYEVLNELA